MNWTSVLALFIVGAINAAVTLNLDKKRKAAERLFQETGDRTGLLKAKSLDIYIILGSIIFGLCMGGIGLALLLADTRP